MCGITGFVRHEQRSHPGDRELLGRMCAAIRHRGPDDEGVLVGDGVALGMRRLSIIDVAGGHQPIDNEDGSVSVVFNGEIYNYRDLQRQLVRAGHRFETASDTEVLVHLYEERGEAMVEALDGMFAFAIWDRRQRRLFVARDRLGIKPLYYEESSDGLAFASELRSLLARPGYAPHIAPAAVAQYLALGYVPDPMSAVARCCKLPPGHVLTWTPGREAVIRRYWSAHRPELPDIDEREAVAHLQQLLDRAVRSHLESEVPLGAFLSGGIDSSTVVALMQRALDRPVRTFSIGFDEPEYNEAPHAARVAAALGTDHTELIVRPDADALLEEVALGFDEPFSDISALPTLLVSHLAREQVTVALSGDGGDELFGGYTRYAEVLASPWSLPHPLRRALRSIALLAPPGARGRAWLLDRARTARGRYTSTVARPLAASEGGVASAAVAALAPAFDALLTPWFELARDRDFATQMMLVDLHTYLPGDILTKVDRMSMAVSLEARVPLLDHHVVEYAVSLPSHLKLRDGTAKWILRRAIEGVVPPAVLAKPKQGFAVPLGRWLRGPLRHRIDGVLDPDSPVYAYVDRAAVARVAAEHLGGRRNHQGLLWRLLVLDLWLRGLAAGELARSRPVRDLLRQSPIAA